MMYTPESVVPLRPKVSEWRGEAWEWGEPKRDGHRMTVVIDSVGQPFARGRKPTLELIHELRRTPELRDLIASMKARTVLDMEVHVNGGLSTDVVPAMKAGRLDFSILAVPHYGGESFLGAEVGVIRQLYEEIRRAHEVDIPFLEGIPYCSTVTGEWLKQRSRDRKIEGYVLKCGMWGPWYKVKPVRTGDFAVIGKTKRVFYNDLKSLRLGYIDKKEGTVVDVGEVGSGFTLEERRAFYEKAPHVVEVEFDSVSTHGKLRFPTFVRVRDGEKTPDECNGEELR